MFFAKYTQANKSILCNFHCYICVLCRRWCV